MRYVLFVCNHNAGRSQMAQAFFEKHAPKDLRAESAGSEPAERVWPEVAEAMKEIGIDISIRKPKKLIPEMQLHADWAVTFNCGDACPYVPATVEDWDVPDPAGQPLEVVQSIRDEIERRVQDLVTNRIELIRSDKTAHNLRLVRLLPSLISEFHATKSAEEIRDCADAILARYADAPIRSFTMTLVTKQVRECLRDETCEALV